MGKEPRKINMNEKPLTGRTHEAMTERTACPRAAHCPLYRCRPADCIDMMCTVRLEQYRNPNQKETTNDQARNNDPV